MRTGNTDGCKLIQVRRERSTRQPVNPIALLDEKEVIPHTRCPKRAHEALEAGHGHKETRKEILVRRCVRRQGKEGPPIGGHLQSRRGIGGEGPAAEDRPGAVPGDLRYEQNPLLRVRKRVAGEEKDERIPIHMAGLQVDPGGPRHPAFREDAAEPDPAARHRGVPR